MSIFTGAEGRGNEWIMLYLPMHLSIVAET